MISVGVTAVGGGVGQSILQSLSYSRMQWRTTGMDTRLLAPGLYWCDNGYLIPPVANEEAYVERLRDIIRDEHLDVLIPGLDVELEPMARHRDVLEEAGCAVIVASPEAVRLSHDKLAFYEFCRRRGLPFVQTYTVAEALEEASTIRFPVIAKPKHGRASVGVRLVHDVSQLEALPRDKDLIVQRYLPPPSAASQRNGVDTSLDQSDEWSVQFFVDDDGQILGHFLSRNELKVGIPLEIVPEENDVVLEGARSIAEALVEEGLRGPVNIQGRETSDGVEFFEVNTRFTGITAVRASMGYREVDAAVEALVLGRTEAARASLSFSTDWRSTRHVEHTTVPAARVKQVERSKDTDKRRDDRAHDVNGRSMRHVLVTGATGYVGLNFIVHLLRSSDCAVSAGVRTADAGDAVRNAVHDPERVRVLEGALPETPWAMEGVDTVVHLAAVREAHIDRSNSTPFFEVNVEGTRRLLARAREAGVRRFVYASSQAVYGTKRNIPWSEMQSPQPETAYGLSKWIAEQLCEGDSAGDMETVALRIAMVFGKGLNMPWDDFPHVLLQDIARERVLTVRGDGTQRTDLIHIRDVCRAIERACFVSLPSGGHTVFNIGSGNPLPVREVVRILRQKAQKLTMNPYEIEYEPCNNSSLDFGVDIRRAKSYLGWSPEVSVEQGIEELVRSALGMGRESTIFE